LVDDASDEACARELDRLAAATAKVSLVRLPQNRGKRTVYSGPAGRP